MPSIVEEAKRLIAEKRRADAQELLLDRGFGRTLEEKAQAAYVTLFPPGAAFKKELAGCLKEMTDSDSAVRLRASKRIESEARGETSNAREEWLKDPRTTGVLIKALDDTEPEIVENAVIALSEIGRRYFKDFRAHPRLVHALASSRALTRVWACQGVLVIGGQDSLATVVPLFRDKSAKVRAAAIRAVVHLAMAEDLTEQSQKILREPLATALDDKEREVRGLASSALRRAGDSGVLKQLEKALGSETDAGQRENLESTIKIIKEKTK